MKQTKYPRRYFRSALTPYLTFVSRSETLSHCIYLIWSSDFDRKCFCSCIFVLYPDLNSLYDLCVICQKKVALVTFYAETMANRSLEQFDIITYHVISYQGIYRKFLEPSFVPKRWINIALKNQISWCTLFIWTKGRLFNTPAKTVQFCLQNTRVAPVSNPGYTSSFLNSRPCSGNCLVINGVTVILWCWIKVV